MLHGALNKTLSPKQDTGDLLHQLALLRSRLFRRSVDLGTTGCAWRYRFGRCWCRCRRFLWRLLLGRWRHFLRCCLSGEPKLFQLFLLRLRNFLHLFCRIFHRALDDVVSGKVPMVGPLRLAHARIICATGEHPSLLVPRASGSSFALLNHHAPLLVHWIVWVNSDPWIVDVNSCLNERMQLLKRCAKHLPKNRILLTKPFES